ncbi:MAG: flagellar M-ring protein FliF [Nitrospirae bacterium]|nr:MAG: flagellar M-ring protein FliF [Nitrospirota bacterium]
MGLTDVIDQIKDWPLKRKVALIFSVVLSIALIAGIVMWSERIDFQVLYSNLGTEDAGQVVVRLKEMKVPYNVEGNVIYVPSNRVYDLRLELASQGVPQGGGVGFEIFDKTQLGVTEFVQKLNYRRALQGELSRTIKQLAEVDQCRVHIAIPEKTIFTDREQHPTASVVLKLKGGRVLNNAQIGGIVHLIASSVEGMRPHDVTVIDNMGTLLSKSSGASGDSAADSKQLEYQKSVEKEYESRLQSMMEGVIGRGKAIVRVATKIDFTQIEKTEERYDPDTIAVRSEQRVQDKSSGPSSGGGVPGVMSNQPGSGQSGAGGGGASAQKQTESINYEVSRSVSKILQPRGEVKSVSVAVLVDGTYKKEKDKKVYVPRNEADLKKYDELVRAAIGFNKDRGDQVIVSNVSFEESVEDIVPEKTDYMKIVSSVLKYLVPIIVVLILVLFVLKPIIDILKVPVRRPEFAPESISMGVGGGKIQEEVSPDEVVKDQVLSIVKQDPRKAAGVLKEWMSE